MYGPPGTAKSGISNAFQKFVNIKPSEYFRYLMTDFTLFHEIFGEELSHQEGTVSRRIIEGKLPTAILAFIDEVWKGNAEILNAFLTILNERTFDNGYEGTIKCPLNTVLAASNEFPRESILKALYERFLFRIPVLNVSDINNRIRLLNGDFDEIGEIIQFDLEDIDYVKKHFKKVRITNEFGMLITRIINELEVMHNISEHQEEKAFQVSSRTHTKLGSVLRLSAYINKRNCIDESDVLLLRYILWDNMKQRERTNPKINEIIFKSVKHYRGRISNEVKDNYALFERYYSNFKPIVSFSNFLNNERSYHEFRDSIIDFHDTFENVISKMEKIKEELEKNILREEAANKNIFIHDKSVLEWRVKEFTVEIKNENWEKVNEESQNPELVVCVDPIEKYYNAFGIVKNTIRTYYEIETEVKAWIKRYDGYFMYKYEFNEKNK
jgi:MoxR-like ATPase